jgi:teichuronic acid biosynthesis glycosyltransferase TuaC
VRVLTFTSLFPNRVQPLLGIFIYQRVAHFAARPGNTVQVIAPVPYFPRWLPWTRWRKAGQVPAEERIGDVDVYHPRYLLLPKVSMPLHGLSMFLGCLFLARRLKKTIGFDCIDAHYVYPDGFAAVLLGKALGLPAVVSARGTDINLFPSFPAIRWIIRWTLRRAAGIVAVSAALRDAMVKLGVRAEKISVIGNGVDAKRFQPLAREAARRALGLPESGPLLISVGTLIPTKGHHLLIAALAEMAPRYPDIKAYILGEGPYRAELEELARGKDVQERVFLVGERPNEELQLWFNAADVSCLLSSREGWPNVLLESLACGTPVVSTRVGGVAEVIASPDLGVLVESDVRSIADGLEAAVQRDWDRAALVRYARARTWEVVAEELAQYLTSVLAGSTRA